MGKKRKNAKNTIKHFKFNILNFNENHYYLFNVTRYKNLIYGINDLNNIKLNKEEIHILQSEIDKCNSINIKNQKKLTIKIIPEFFEFFNKIKRKDLKNSEYAKKMSFILDDLKNKHITITLKQIANQYKIFYGKKISISTASRILKNHLGMRYLRTSIKNPKLEENDYLFMSFIFIRILLKSLLLNLEVIFLDETGFLLQNNNYFTWRCEKEQVLDGPKNKGKERLNLIIAVSNKKIIHKKFLKESVDTKKFIEFLKEMIEDMTEEQKRKIIIVMDNASYHVGYDVVQFFREEKIKGLTICPYRSTFNMSELVFRYTKNIIYKNIYNKMEDLKQAVINILNSNNLQKSLMNLYKETLQQYVIFIENYDWLDLTKVIENN